jgi:HK97 family phage prohead protease
VLWAHDQSQPPVAKALSRSLKVDGKKLIATAQFMPADVSEFSYMIFQMYKLGFMNATSVGFRPLEWSFAEDDKRPYGVNFTKQELLEFSCVPVPANADALMGAKSMGVNTRPLKSWVENALDGWKEEGDLLVPKSNLECLYKSLTARAKLLKPIEEAMTTETEDKTVETETKEVTAEVKEVVVEEKKTPNPNDSDSSNSSEKVGPEANPAIQEAHALHKTALSLSRHAAAMHRKANTMLQKIFDPDGAQDGDGTDYAPNEKSLSEVENILKTFEVKETEGAETEVKVVVDPSPVMEMIKQLQLNVIALQTQLHAEKKAVEVTEVVKTEEVEETKEASADDEYMIIFEDSVDTDEDSVNVEEVKELLQSIDFVALIDESLKKKLGSKV